MPDFSQVLLIGHLGRDAETRFTANGKAVTSFSLAVSRTFGGNKTTSWFNVSLWGKEKLTEYLTKGKAVGVSGEIFTRDFERKDGSKGTSVEVSGNSVTFLDGKAERDEFDQRPAPRSVPKTAAALKAGEWTGTDPGPGIDDGDCPF